MLVCHLLFHALLEAASLCHESLVLAFACQWKPQGATRDKHSRGTSDRVVRRTRQAMARTYVPDSGEEDMPHALGKAPGPASFSNSRQSHF